MDLEEKVGHEHVEKSREVSYTMSGVQREGMMGIEIGDLSSICPQLSL